MAYSQCWHPKYIIYIIKLEFLEHFYNFKVSQGQKHSCINNTPKKKEKKSPRTFLTPGISYGKKKMLLDDGLRRDAKYFDQTGYLDLDPSGRCCLLVRTGSIMRVPHWRIDFYHGVRMPSSARSDTLTWARSALKKRVYGWDQILRSSTENSKLATAKIILFNDDIKINRKNKLIRKICLSARKEGLFVICFWSQTDENEAEQDFICFVSFDLI